MTFRLARVQHRLNAQAAATLRTHSDLSLTEWRVIHLINDPGETTAAAICREAQMDKGQISRALKRLMDRGLVLSRENAADHRQSLVRLSPEGLETWSRLVVIMRKRQRRLTRDVTEAELEVFYEVLEKLDTKAAEPVT